MDTDTCTDVATFSSAVSGVVLSFGRHGHWFRRRPNGKRRFTCTCTCAQYIASIRKGRPAPCHLTHVHSLPEVPRA